MKSYKSKISKQQREDFKKLIDKGSKRISKEGYHPFIIIGMLRLPDDTKGIKEPEIEFAMLTDRRAETVEASYKIQRDYEPEDECGDTK